MKVMAEGLLGENAVLGLVPLPPHGVLERPLGNDEHGAEGTHTRERVEAPWFSNYKMHILFFPAKHQIKFPYIQKKNHATHLITPADQKQKRLELEGKKKPLTRKL